MNRKKTIFCIISLVAITILFTFSANANFNYSKIIATQQQEIDGYYYLAGKTAKTFPEIDHIHFSTYGGIGKTVPLNGFIRLKKKNITNYTFSSIKLEGKNLTFTTKAIQGIYYQFTGKLLTDSVIDSSPDDIVLKGNLKKFQGEKVINQQDVNLTYFTGD